MSPVKKSSSAEQKASRTMKKTADESTTTKSRRSKKQAEAPRSAGPLQVTPEERRKMIEEAAYYRAEKAGFTGDPLEHWLAAEKEVDAMLKAGIRPGSS